MMDCSNRRLYIWSTETMLLTLIKWSLEHVGYKLLTLFYCDIMNSFWIISKDYMYTPLGYFFLVINQGKACIIMLYNVAN